ncbi:MAG: VIT domain-containing protein [Myxococcales bacterium]|nr:VIT domain-containing protein [Myxococcales bacterium]
MTTHDEEKFWDELALLVDGDPAAAARHAPLLAENDRLRDARHDATRLAELVRDASADYRHPLDLDARVLNALDARTRGGLPTNERISPSLAAPATPTHAAPSGSSHPAETQTGPTSAGAFGPLPPAATGAGASSSRRDDAARPRPGSRRPSAGLLVALGATGLLAAAAVVTLALASGLLGSRRPGDPTAAPSAARGGALTATVVRVARASTEARGGLSVRRPGSDAFVPLGLGETVPPGASVRTDERTRAELELSDGSRIALDHATELLLEASAPRGMTVRRGQLVADVAHLPDGPRAVFTTPTGRVEVLGTKFALTAADDIASVRVVHGEVRLQPEHGRPLSVRPGQEGLMGREVGTRLLPVVDLASSIAWADLEPEADGEPLRGLGELRARRPGEREDRERPLSLALHRVRVRIVGNVAHTEIEEVFRNDSDQTLEGIYRFPLPSEARIASLALEVDGRWEMGAFVERDRAQKIWRGVIRNATPQQRRDPREEFIWVPGPWHDPALLEWQRGGRFELRIFPIPARGERRVRLSYEQTLDPHGTGRRYVYPLAHSVDGSTRIGRFEIDVRLTGHDRGARPIARGYPLAPCAPDGSDGGEGAVRLCWSADGFLPAGDLALDFRLPNERAEVRAWAYRGIATVPPAEHSREGDPEVVRLQRVLHEDGRGYALFALRPELPAWTEQRPRDYVLVADVSQSMVGERHERLGRLLEAMVAQMDRRDRVLVLACDAECRAMGSVPTHASAAFAQQVRAFVASVRPAGATDLVGAMRAAARALARFESSEREVRVIYVGDGIASVGHRRASMVAAAELSRATGVSFTTVGIGTDADAALLRAVARAGGGHFVPYTPGRSVRSAALAVLQTTYGVTLRDATLTLPAGVVDVAPATLPSIRAGEEVLVAARLDRDEIEGELVLRGKVGGQPYENRFPIRLSARAAAGNAFVPTVWAAKTIEQLELGADAEAQRARIIAMSKAYGVLSRHTSLLVLESEAMFRAFGVDRVQARDRWTGDEEAETVESDGVVSYVSPTVTVAGAGAADARGSMGSGFEGGRARLQRAPAGDVHESLSLEAMESPRSPAASAEPRALPVPEPHPELRMRTPTPNRGGRWMRKVWYRTGRVVRDPSVRPADTSAVFAADAQLAASPESRDRTRALYRALARAGDVGRARQAVDRWLAKDPLDPDALVALSDVLARQGKRDEAIRVLSGVVDLRPDDVALHERLAAAFERAEMRARACAHRIAISELRRDDADAVAAAVRCERAQGHDGAALRLLNGSSIDRARLEAAVSRPPVPTRATGEVVLEAAWSGGEDLDVALVTPQGVRVSWLGGRAGVAAELATAPGRERLGLRRIAVGTYYVEVTRSRPGTGIVTGRVDAQVLGMHGTLPFTLSGERAVVGRIEVSREFRLEPVW